MAKPSFTEIFGSYLEEELNNALKNDTTDEKDVKNKQQKNRLLKDRLLKDRNGEVRQLIISRKKKNSLWI